MKTRSITRQAVVSILLAELLCLVAFTAVALLHEWQTRLHALDTTIQGRSDSLAGAIQDAEDPDDNVTIDPEELKIPPHDVYAAYNENGRMVGASSHAPEGLIERDEAGFSNRREGRHRYRVLQRSAMRIIDRAEHQGVGLRRPVTIVYAVRADQVWHEVLEAVRFYFIASVLLIAITAFAMIVLLRRFLRPIDELAVAAGAVSARSLLFHAPASVLAVRELQPLAHALRNSVDGLRRSFEQQHRFVGDAAHELKTAVAVVRSSTQVLMMQPRSSKEYEQGLRGILQDNSRMEMLAARMLSLARVEERASTERMAEDQGPGEARLDTGVRTDLSAAAATVAERLRSFAVTHGVVLAPQLAASAPVPLGADDAEILVSNLLVNAVQHSLPDTAVQLQVEHRAASVLLHVRDRGTGISPAALPHVFERFFREDTSRSRETGGAGLGLAICRSLVEGAGGTIAIESTAGAGTVVTVMLPAAFSTP